MGHYIMELNTLRGLSSSELESAVAQKRVVIFSPRSRSRNIFMAEFAAGANSYLYRLLQQDVDLSTFLQNLSSELVETLPNMGTQIRQASGRAKSTTLDLADALAADLKKTDARFLILDEFDRLEVNAETVQFFER